MHRKVSREGTDGVVGTLGPAPPYDGETSGVWTYFALISRCRPSDAYLKMYRLGSPDPSDPTL
jgi:hypothetical protein